MLVCQAQNEVQVHPAFREHNSWLLFAPEGKFTKFFVSPDSLGGSMNKLKHVTCSVKVNNRFSNCKSTTGSPTLD